MPFLSFTNSPLSYENSYPLHLGGRFEELQRLRRRIPDLQEENAELRQRWAAVEFPYVPWNQVNERHGNTPR